MSIKQIIILSTFALNILTAQTISIVETVNISKYLPPGQYFYPKFSLDDSKILFSTSNYKGLYSFNLSTKKIITISEKNGAGYNPFISEDRSEIFYRTFKMQKGRKFSTVNSYDLLTSTNKIIAKDKRRISIPNQKTSGKLITIENSQVKNYSLQKDKLSKSIDEKKAIYVENNNLILINGDIKKVLNPLGKGIYVWETLSKDGQRIIFSFANKGAFICNLEGEILHNIPKAHYPRLSPNGKYLLYMIDKDNGYQYTASDLFIYSLENKQSYRLTNTNDMIEMYAEWSNDGNSIVYHTLSGKIYLSKLKIDN